MSFKVYSDHGWKLCAVPRGLKDPPTRGGMSILFLKMQSKGLRVSDLHTLSGTCCLDIDSLDLARPWLAERGVDLDALLSDPYAVRIDSGRPGRS